MAVENSNRPVRSRTFTFRLDEDTIEALSSEADAQKLSINVVAQKALRRYVKWDIIADRFRYMAATPQLLQRLMTWIPDENAKEIGRWHWENAMRPLATSYFWRLGVESAVAILELLSTYGHAFKFDRTTTGSKHLLVIMHDMGKKWSLFYEGMLSAMLEENFRGEIKAFQISATDSQVVAELSTMALTMAHQPKATPRFIDDTQMS